MTRGVLGRALAPVLALLLVPLASCSDDTPHYSYDAAEEAARGIRQALHVRVRAVRTGNEADFLRTVVDDPAFRDEQATYFDNLRQLPLGSFGYRLDRSTLERAGETGAYWAEVEVGLRLQGYDAAAVRTRDRLLFRPTGKGAYRLASATDETWERNHLTGSQPWDVGAIEVREEAGVLGIFDEVTVDDASSVLDEVSAARDADLRVVPVAKVPQIVVYATSDASFLEELAGTPGGDPDLVDAMTVPVPVDLDRPGGRIASYRVLIGDSAIGQDPEALGRLVRHETAHVLLGGRGAGAPLWLTEGIAEYVSVQSMPSSQRQLPPDALELATGGVTDLPPDDAFTGPDAPAWYAVAWWTCEYVARTYGRSTLFALLDDLRGGVDVAPVLRRVLGLTPDELARRGADLMAQTYT